MYDVLRTEYYCGSQSLAHVALLYAHHTRTMDRYVDTQCHDRRLILSIRKLHENSGIWDYCQQYRRYSQC